MTRLASSLLAISLCLTSLPADAGNFVSRSGARVFPLSNGIFEVVPSARTSGGDYWCAAGDFAQRSLRAPWTARVFVVQGRAPSVTNGRRSAVQFTLDPQAAGVTPLDGALSINSLRPGDNMTVQSAFSYCGIRPNRF